MTSASRRRNSSHSEKDHKTSRNLRDVLFSAQPPSVSGRFVHFLRISFRGIVCVLSASIVFRLGIPTPQAQYELAFMGNSMVDDLEKRFDAV